MPDKNIAVTAEEMAKGLKEISVSEFFEKNRHLLGFDNPQKALITVVKEAVDNSLDACEEAKILPEIKVELKELAEDRYRVIVEDNGPGIVKEQIPRIFGKLLYGSKFHRLRQSRGQQGIGISAAVLYAQLTTGKPIKIIARTAENKPTNVYELHIDTIKNEPEITSESILSSSTMKHGVRVELDVAGKFVKSKHSPYEYISQCAIMNPYAKFSFKEPDGTKTVFERVIDKLPTPPKEIKPHPYGIELGILLRMLKNARSRNVSGFLRNDFSRMGAKAIQEVCAKAKIDPSLDAKKLTRDEAEKLLKAMQTVQLMAPPTNCLSPLGEEAILAGLKKEIKADFYAAVSRPPAVYRGYPFQIEAGIAYGGELDPQGAAKVVRFANRVPLLYELSACASSEAVTEVNFKRYGLEQTGGKGMPSGPVLLLVHMASVWVPFTSESKEAIASYPEIIDEIKLAVQEAGRQLGKYLSGKRKAHEREHKRKAIEKYAPEVAKALNIITKEDEQKILKMIQAVAEKKFLVINKEELEEEAPEKEEEAKPRITVTKEEPEGNGEEQ